MRILALILSFIACIAQAQTVYVVVPRGYKVRQSDTTYFDKITRHDLNKYIRLFGYSNDSVKLRNNYFKINPVQYNSFPAGVTVYTITPN